MQLPAFLATDDDDDDDDDDDCLLDATGDGNGQRPDSATLRANSHAYEQYNRLL